MQNIKRDTSNIKAILISDSWLIKNGLQLLISNFFNNLQFFDTVRSFEQSLNNNSKNTLSLIICDIKESPKLRKSLIKTKSIYAIVSLTTEKFYTIQSENEFIISIFDNRDDIIETLHRSLDFLNNFNWESNHTVLSAREIDILRLISQGDSSQQIAQKLNISFNTVNTHRKNIASKLGIKTASGQAAYAIINNLIDVDNSTLSR